VLPDFGGDTLRRSRDGGLGLLGGEYMALISTFTKTSCHIISEGQFQKALILEQRGSQPLSKQKSKRRTIESAVPIKRVFSAAIAYRHV
jgi:hypothetical protein